MTKVASNRRKGEVDTTPGEWWDWSETNLADRAIRFIETYLRNPKGYGYGQPVVLSPEQKAWFREILDPNVSMAVKSCMRGEGKSTECAALAIWRGFDRNESGAPQIPIIATTLNQAERSVYTVVLQMVAAEPELAERSIEYGARGSQKLIIPSTNGEIFPMANGEDGLQGLDPLLAIMDEIGFQTMEAWDSVLLASGKRPDSLVLGVGTPGFNRNNALWHIRQAHKENGGSEGFKFLEVAAPDGCDYKDEKVWYDASPALRAGYKNINALRSAVNITPEAHFRIFYLGQWVEGSDSWLGPEGKRVWDSGNSEYELDLELPIYGGLDVGVTSDSTAFVVMQERPDTMGKIHAQARIWVPPKGQRIDITDIQQYLREFCAKYNVRSINYDPRLFEVAGDQLIDEGLPLNRTPQSPERLGPTFTELYRAFHENKFSHPDDEQFRTQVLNGVARHFENGFLISKMKSNGKIDACVAMCMAYMAFLSKKPARPPLSFATI